MYTFCHFPAFCRFSISTKFIFYAIFHRFKLNNLSNLAHLSDTTLNKINQFLPESDWMDFRIFSRCLTYSGVVWQTSQVWLSNFNDTCKIWHEVGQDLASILASIASKTLFGSLITTFPQPSEHTDYYCRGKSPSCLLISGRRRTQSFSETSNSGNTSTKTLQNIWKLPKCSLFQGFGFQISVMHLKNEY